MWQLYYIEKNTQPESFSKVKNIKHQRANWRGNRKSNLQYFETLWINRAIHLKL